MFLAAHIQKTSEEKGKKQVDFYRIPYRSFPHVPLHLIVTNTESSFSQKSPGGRKAELGFRLGSVWALLPLEWKHHRGRNFLFWWLLSHRSKWCSVQSHLHVQPRPLPRVARMDTQREGRRRWNQGGSSDMPMKHVSGAPSCAGGWETDN